MKSKMMFRIELKTLDYGLAKDTAMIAALSNGGGCVINLIGLQAYANVKKAEIGYKDVTVSLIGNTLLIDKGTELLLRLDEVEVCDLEVPQITPQDARDILDELSPSLNRYANPQGLADNSNHEALN